MWVNKVVAHSIASAHRKVGSNARCVHVVHNRRETYREAVRRQASVELHMLAVAIVDVAARQRRAPVVRQAVECGIHWKELPLWWAGAQTWKETTTTAVWL